MSTTDGLVMTGGLASYRGPANDADVLRHLVGEKITAAFQGHDGKIWIVCTSGAALCFGSLGGGNPVFWAENESTVEREVARRRAEIERKLQELRDLPGVELP